MVAARLFSVQVIESKRYMPEAVIRHKNEEW
jgi:hypothetical protein